MKKAVCLGLTVLLTACTQGAQRDLKTQLQVREYQTRTFNTSQTNEVLTAVVEAFQDQGFMVKNVVPQVGLVSATREVDVEDSGTAAFQIVFFGQNARWSKNAIIEATANVKTQGKTTRVRATFQEKVLNNHGGMESVRTLEDPKFYQDFFDKVGKSIFFESQRL